MEISNVNVIPTLINSQFQIEVASDTLFFEIMSRFESLSKYLVNGVNNDMFWKTASEGYVSKTKRNFTALYKEMGIKSVFVMLKRLKVKHIRLLLGRILRINIIGKRKAKNIKFIQLLFAFKSE